MSKTIYRWDPISDALLSEQDENGDTIATYTHEAGQFGELISQHRSGQANPPLPDHHGHHSHQRGLSQNRNQVLHECESTGAPCRSQAYAQGVHAIRKGGHRHVDHRCGV